MNRSRMMPLPGLPAAPGAWDFAIQNIAGAWDPAMQLQQQQAQEQQQQQENAGGQAGGVQYHAQEAAQQAPAEPVQARALPVSPPSCRELVSDARLGHSQHA
jgi:hypothetical protein